MAGEGGLHLAELDAEAADLDLVVDASEELEVAVGQEPCEVAGAEEPPAVAFHELLGGQLRPAASSRG